MLFFFGQFVCDSRKMFAYSLECTSEIRELPRLKSEYLCQISARYEIGSPLKRRAPRLPLLTENTLLPKLIESFIRKFEYRFPAASATLQFDHFYELPQAFVCCFTKTPSVAAAFLQKVPNLLGKLAQALSLCFERIAKLRISFD